jgi:hypothetical protein
MDPLNQSVSSSGPPLEVSTDLTPNQSSDVPTWLTLDTVHKAYTYGMGELCGKMWLIGRGVRCFECLMCNDGMVMKDDATLYLQYSLIKFVTRCIRSTYIMDAPMRPSLPLVSPKRR